MPSSARSTWLLISTFSSAFAYAFPHFGPWGQANPANNGWIGPQNSAEIGDVVLFALGVFYWLYVLCLVHKNNFDGFEDRVTRATVWTLMFWSFALFTGRFSSFSFAVNYTLSSKVAAGQPNATVWTCSYPTMDYNRTDCLNLIGATLVVAYMWLAVWWYWVRGSAWELWLCCVSPRKQIGVPNVWRVFDWTYWGWQPGAFLGDADVYTNSNYVNTWKYGAYLQMLWLIALAANDGVQWYAVNNFGTYLYAQVAYSTVSLVAYVVSAFAWIASVSFGVYDIRVPSSVNPVSAGARELVEKAESGY